MVKRDHGFLGLGIREFGIWILVFGPSSSPSDFDILISDLMISTTLRLNNQ